MNCAWRRATEPVGTMRCTVGFEIPDRATSFFASVGLYGVHFTDASYHALDGAIGVQPGRFVPLNTTLFRALRSIASSNALRIFKLGVLLTPGSSVAATPSSAWRSPALSAAAAAAASFLILKTILSRWTFCLA